MEEEKTGGQHRAEFFFAGNNIDPAASTGESNAPELTLTTNESDMEVQHHAHHDTAKTVKS